MVRTRGTGRCIIGAVIASAGLAATASAQLRVANWNISVYNGADATRDPAFQTALFATAPDGRKFDPDILMLQELNSSSVNGTNAFLALMNNATAPGTFAAGTWFSGPDTTVGLIYRVSKVQFLGAVKFANGGADPLQPRDSIRYDVRVVGYNGNPAVISLYPTHMKSSTGSANENRRLAEVNNIRANVASLLAADSTALLQPRAYIIGGDFNIGDSGQAAYQGMVAGAVAGRFFDPISLPGSWQNNSTYRFVHTQAPGGNPANTGGMDDRFDQILLSANLIDGITGQSLEYIGNAAAPWNLSTWNDPNHSYRCWGNDGTSFNTSLTIAGNANVGSTIAQALVTSCITDTAGGHLPVYLDMRVPPKVAATPTTINFGTVNVGDTATQTITIGNGADVGLWTVNGIATLSYTMGASAGFTAPAGTFTNAAGAAGNIHTLTMDTSTPGTLNGTLTINSNSPEGATVVTLTGVVQAASTPCYANCDGSTGTPLLSAQDFSCFLSKFRAGDSYANCDGSTDIPSLTAVDFSCFLSKFRAGCP